jgi:hypothetical protein
MRGRADVPLWGAFLLAHAWLVLLGVAVVPGEAFHDVDLYRWWAHLSLAEGRWPVLDEPWVYPAGALVPVLLPAFVTTTSTAGYALVWSAMVTALDVLALRVVLTRVRGGRRAGWWWTAFLVLLGPVAVGRLDAVVAPLMVLALVVALRRPALASALLTAGAWVKVAPGALLLPVVAAARRPWRDVVLPAAGVCVAVVGAVTLGGGLDRVAGFLTEQTGRGLQVESVTATGWVLAARVRQDVVVGLNEELVTYEVHGPGTQAAADLLDLVLPLAVAAVAAVLLLARRRGRAAAAFLPGALTLVAVLVVANKVGSPQLLAWFAAPAMLLVAARRTWSHGAAPLLLAAAAATQLVFPWGYLALLDGSLPVTLTLVLRNLLLVAVLVVAAVGLVRAVREDDPTGAEPADALDRTT